MNRLKRKLDNPKVLIVGSFPKKNIYGGIERSCKLILEYKHFKKIKIKPFDSSQISNPPPPFFVRMYLAIIRLIRFVIKLQTERPKASLIFCSAGASAIEKGVMVFLCKMFQVKALIFPRAGVLIEQTEKSIIFKKLIKILFAYADFFLAQGENWAKYAENQLRIPLSKIKLIHNWTATSDLLRLGSIKDKKISKQPINFLFVGWLEKEKGIYEILKALRYLDNKKYKFTFTFIGDGREMEPAIKFVIKNRLEKKVNFKGWVDSKNIKYYYQEAEIFVLPSWSEGMPNALIEALACGLTAIVTGVGMITNYLEDGYNALIIPSRDPNSLTIAMEKVLLDEDLKKKISKNGHLLANKYFSTEKGLTSLERTIKQLF